jgi:hypothetical protein
MFQVFWDMTLDHRISGYGKMCLQGPAELEIPDEEGTQPSIPEDLKLQK